MFLLAAGCVVLGILPQVGLPLIQQAAAQWMDPATQVTGLPASLAPIQWISGAALALIVVSGLVITIIRKNIRKQPAVSIGTWSCGYAQPTPRMQYTATSFGEMLVNRFSWALRPRKEQPVITPLFPGRTGFSTQVPDTVLDRIVLPVFQYAGRQMMKLRLLQQGRTDIYLLYILIITLFLFCWESLGIGR